MSGADLRGVDAVGAAAPFVAELLAELLARMDAVRRELEACAQRVERAPEDAWGSAGWLERSEGLQDESTRLGWGLGVLAAASDVDLLLARRESDGVRALAALAEARLARRGVVLDPGAAELPRFAGAVATGWELAFLVGAALFDLGRHGARVRWRFERGAAGWTLALDGAPSDGWRALARGLAPRLSGLTVETDGGRVALRGPAAWLRGRRGGPA